MVTLTSHIYMSKWKKKQVANLNYYFKENTKFYSNTK